MNTKSAEATAAIDACGKNSRSHRDDECEISDFVEYWLYYRYQESVEEGYLKWHLGEKFYTERDANEAAKRDSAKMYASGYQYEYKVCKVTCKHEILSHYVKGVKQ